MSAPLSEAGNNKSAWVRNLIVMCVLALFSAGFVLALDLGGLILPLQLKAYDALFYLRAKTWPARTQAESPVLIVGIDDRTLSDPTFRLPRILWHNYFAQVIGGLADGEAKVIGLDFLLPQTMFDDLVPDYSRTWLRALLEAEKKGTRVVTGVIQTAGGQLKPEARYLQMIGSGGLGLFNLTTDSDDFCRRQRLFFPSEDDPQKGVYSMAFVAAQTFKPGLQLPAEEIYIDFVPRPGGLRQVSFGEVYHRAMAQDIEYFQKNFKGKIVLMGETDTLTQDRHPTPLYHLIRQGHQRTPGVEILGHTVNTILGGRYFSDAGWPTRLAIYFLLALAVSAFTLLVPQRYLLVFTPGLLLAYLAASVAAFAQYFILPLASGVAAALIGQTASFSYRFWVVEKEKKKAEGESAEAGRMLGLSFQSQGLLDMAFEKFIHLPVDDALKDIIYNLALDYERKRQFKKAVMVYEYLQGQDGNYRDIKDRLTRLRLVEDGMILGLGVGGTLTPSGELIVDGGPRPTLGRYEIYRLLGQGAMGLVYLGRDPKIGRETAIKTIRFTAEFDREDAERLKSEFFGEAETAGKLSHPNIVTIYDAGEDQDLSYIAMEYIDGENLKPHTRRDGLLPFGQVASIMADAAEALDYAHSHGVVHRDIKPANIMLQKNGRPKITDFGIAKAMSGGGARTGVIKGTQLYMSPEQIMGKGVDGRSDVYSLGLVLYEMLTGVHPYKTDDLTVLIYKVLSEVPSSVKTHDKKLPKAFDQILARALAKDRDQRYPTAGHMAAHLKKVAQKVFELTGSFDLSGRG